MQLSCTSRPAEKTELGTATIVIYTTLSTINTVRMLQLSSYIIQELDFERMMALSLGEDKGWLEGMTYAEFFQWNMNCINELSDEDDAWLVGLCRRMNNGDVVLQDMESCSHFPADGLYFDYNKRIIIVNPR